MFNATVLCIGTYTYTVYLYIILQSIGILRVCVRKFENPLEYRKHTFLIGIFSETLIYSFFNYPLIYRFVAITERIYYVLSVNIIICQVYTSIL